LNQDGNQETLDALRRSAEEVKKEIREVNHGRDKLRREADDLGDILKELEDATSPGQVLMKLVFEILHGDLEAEIARSKPFELLQKKFDLLQRAKRQELLAQFADRVNGMALSGD
jgi:septal ring factor EnvC (AmiA/AmiB activator)